MAFMEKLFKVKVSSKGQVVIPKHLREALDLKKGDELLLVPTDEGILLKHPSKDKGAKGLRGLLRGLDVDVVECEAILGEAKRGLVRTIG